MFTEGFEQDGVTGEGEIFCRVVSEADLHGSRREQQFRKMEEFASDVEATKGRIFYGSGYKGVGRWERRDGKFSGNH